MRLTTHTAQASQRHLSTPGFTTSVTPSQYSCPAFLRDDARHARRCTRQCCSVHLLSFRLDGSKNSLVKRDHEEVCPLSRGVISQPLSIQLQNGVRFFLVPLPAAPTVFLAVHLPLPAALRAYPVPLIFLSGADPPYSPAAQRPRWPTRKEPCLTAYHFGSSLSAPLACLA